MPVTLMTNEIAMIARRNLEQTNQRLNTTFQRLSTGSRIVRSSDDPAGLAISDKLNAQIRSISQAVRNAQDDISLIQVFEGGTSEISNIIIRLRELAMQSSSDSINDDERSLLNNESTQLLEEVTRIARTTQFSGVELLSGAITDVEYQVRNHNDPDVDRIRFAPGDTNMTADALGIDGIDVSSKDDAQDSLDTLDTALAQVNEIRARIGSAQSRFNSTIQAQLVFQENLTSAKSRIRDADIAEEAANMARESILRQAGVAVLAQANESPQVVLQLLRSTY